mmetsp:Transcript_17350/g.40450  ORF Transcript_17350/g.40450 Transcript_17350/m.40450 type:complete len:209 (+) Transcript_17350:1785-2411(+)
MSPSPQVFARINKFRRGADSLAPSVEDSAGGVGVASGCCCCWVCCSASRSRLAQTLRSCFLKRCEKPSDTQATISWSASAKYASQASLVTVFAPCAIASKCCSGERPVILLESTCRTLNAVDHCSAENEPSSQQSSHLYAASKFLHLQRSTWSSASFGPSDASCTSSSSCNASARRVSVAISWGITLLSEVSPALPKMSMTVSKDGNE